MNSSIFISDNVFQELTFIKVNFQYHCVELQTLFLEEIGNKKIFGIRMAKVTNNFFILPVNSVREIKEP